MDRNGRLGRKAFVTTLGAAGLGLGITATGARAALAQEELSPPTCPHDAHMAMPMPMPMPMAMCDGTMPMDDAHLQLRTAFYTAFTAALAEAWGGTSGDEVDAAIRQAMMSLIDARQSDAFLTYGQAEALKILIATTDAPLCPGPVAAALFSLDQGMAAPGMMPGPEGMAESPMMPGHEHEDMEGQPMMPGHDGMEGAMMPGQEEIEAAVIVPEQEGMAEVRRERRRARKTRRARDQ